MGGVLFLAQHVLDVELYLFLTGAMDTFARGLKCAARIVEDGILSGAIKVPFYSWQNPSGAALS